MRWPGFSLNGGTAEQRNSASKLGLVLVRSLPEDVSLGRARQASYGELSTPMGHKSSNNSKCLCRCSDYYRQAFWRWGPIFTALD